MNTRNLALTAAMAALMCLAGILFRWVSPALVPFSILPVLMLLSGLILGARYGALAMIVYIFLGLLGLPVFSSAPFGGIGYIFKPTFGYLLGYIGAAFTVGIIYKKKQLWSAIIAVLAGLTVLYTFGLGYLYVVMNYILGRPTTVGVVLATGFLPFIAMDLVKAGIAAWVGNEVIKRRQE
ncbi:MAG: biotin transporter BioY [Peptococcaceae bacterium]|nr:biotin transporter BioY [Peptococcaceae bacterium]